VPELARVCVYCGSSTGNDAAFTDSAERLGRLLADRGIGVVYGGASVGLMGVVANAALDGGAEVIGVIPGELFADEVAHAGLTELHVVSSMHERKALMSQLADAFIALPGGFGTLDELFEITTWAQIGLHEKPIGLLDTAGYWEGLKLQVHRALKEGFVAEGLENLLVIEQEPGALLDRLLKHVPPPPAVRWQTNRSP
jgi:uncharacterized protein (TIGR00730 family)